MLRRNLISVEYHNIARERVSELKEHFNTLYHPDYCLQFMGWIEEESGYYYNLKLFFNECVTLSEFLFNKHTGQYSSTNLRPTYYIFYKIAEILDHYANLGEYYGDICEANIFVDQDHKIRMFWYPMMHSRDNQCKAGITLSSEKSLRYTGLLLSPEILSLLRDEDPNFSFDMDMKKSDIFSLGLMCIRLLSPETFYRAYDIENLWIDLRRLDYLLETIGVFVNSQISKMLKKCLEFIPELRPHPSSLLEYMEELSIERMPKCIDEVDILSEEEMGLIIEDTFIGGKINIGEELDDYSTEHSLEQLDRVKREGGFEVHYKTPKKCSKISDILSSNSKNKTLKNLKKKCLRYLEKEVYNRLPVKEKVSSIGNSEFRLKEHPSGYNVGWITSKNGEMYFGFLKNFQKSLKGITFYQNEELQYGDYSAGRATGIGIKYFNNGDRV